jgi:hypothetical protein
MSDPSRDPPVDDLDARYRRATALDPSRPSDSVRRAVLAEAARLAAERRATTTPQRWRRRALFGMLAAAALVGLVLSPTLLRPVTAPIVARQVAAPAPAADESPSERAMDTRSRAGATAARDAAKSRLFAGRAPAAAAPAAPPAAVPAAATAPALAEAQTSPARPQPFTSAAANLSAKVSGGAQTDRAMDRDRSRSELGATLRRAAASGDVGALRSLLGKPLDIDAPDEAGRTALMLATLNRHALAVEVLLQHGADPNIADDRGVTALQAAGPEESEITAALKLAGAR